MNDILLRRNREKRYEELKAKYKISLFYGDKETQEKIMRENDFVFTSRSMMYKKEFEIIKCPEELSDFDKAIILDDGNLCFGWRSLRDGKVIWVFTD